MSNFRTDRILVIDDKEIINKHDTIKITLDTDEVIQGRFMQIKTHLYTEIEIVRRGVIWGFDIAGILKIEKVEK